MFWLDKACIDQANTGPYRSNSASRWLAYMGGASPNSKLGLWRVLGDISRVIACVKGYITLRVQP